MKYESYVLNIYYILLVFYKFIEENCSLLVTKFICTIFVQFYFVMEFKSLPRLGEISRGNLHIRINN